MWTDKSNNLEQHTFNFWQISKIISVALQVKAVDQSLWPQDGKPFHTWKWHRYRFNVAANRPTHSKTDFIISYQLCWVNSYRLFVWIFASCLVQQTDFCLSCIWLSKWKRDHMNHKVAASSKQPNSNPYNFSGYISLKRIKKYTLCKGNLGLFDKTVCLTHKTMSDVYDPCCWVRYYLPYAVVPF